MNVIKNLKVESVHHFEMSVLKQIEFTLEEEDLSISGITKQ